MPPEGEHEIRVWQIARVTATDLRRPSLLSGSLILLNRGNDENESQRSVSLRSDHIRSRRRRGALRHLSLLRLSSSHGVSISRVCPNVGRNVSASHRISERVSQDNRRQWNQTSPCVLQRLWLPDICKRRRGQAGHPFAASGWSCAKRASEPLPSNLVRFRRLVVARRRFFARHPRTVIARLLRRMTK
jgi:hypothetical protein